MARQIGFVRAISALRNTGRRVGSGPRKAWKDTESWEAVLGSRSVRSRDVPWLGGVSASWERLGTRGRPPARLWRSAAQRHDATGPGPAPSPGTPGGHPAMPPPRPRGPPPIDGRRAPCRLLQPNCHRTSGATWLPLIARHNPCTLIAPVSGRHSRRIRSKLRQSRNPPGPCRDMPNRVSPVPPSRGTRPRPAPRCPAIVGDPSPDRHTARPCPPLVYDIPGPVRRDFLAPVPGPRRRGPPMNRGTLADEESRLVGPLESRRN
jgi:hypothetical protein